MKQWLKNEFPTSCSWISDYRWKLQSWMDDLFHPPVGIKRIENGLRHSHEVTTKHSQVPAKPMKIMFFTFRAWLYHLAIDSFLAVRMKQLGHDVSMITCEEDVSFCQIGDINQPARWQCHCDECMRLKRKMAGSYIPLFNLGGKTEVDVSNIKTMRWPECAAFEWRGLPIGEYCMASLRWFLCRGVLNPEEDLTNLQDALSSALIVAENLSVILGQEKPDCCLIFSGEFFAERICKELCKEMNIRFVTHELGQTKDTLFWRTTDLPPNFVNDTYYIYRQECLSKAQHAKIEQFYENRFACSSHEWNKAEYGKDEICRAFGIMQRPTAVAFTGVPYESAVASKSHMFDSDYDWLDSLINYFCSVTEAQLIIRCHPGEVTKQFKKTNMLVEDVIRKRNPHWPPNVILISAKSNVSSYALMDMAVCGLVYTSSTGLEMTVKRKPVITAVNTWYSGYGFTVDPETTDAYFNTIGEALAGRLAVTTEQLEEAYRFAYHFYFERMIPFEMLKLNRRTLGVEYVKGKERAFARGKLPGIETVCRIITDNAPPVFDLEG